jgi:cell division protein FtsW
MGFFQRDIFKGDKVIWMIFFFLCLISILEVFSAASTLTYKSNNIWKPIIQHIFYLGVGTAMVLFVHNIPCRYFKLIPVSLFIIIPVLGYTSVAGVVQNGGARWIEILGITIQPSEFAKGILVVFTAVVLSINQSEKGADPNAFKYIIFFTLLICGLIGTENLSTAAMLFAVICMMMFIGRVPLSQLGKMFGVFAIVGVVGILTLSVVPKETIAGVPKLQRFTTWSHRIEKFSDNKSEVTPDSFDIDKDAQVAHANIAIATGGIIGKMPGNSVERDFLSQAFSDFIFAIIIEEIGLLGGGFVVVLYLILLFRVARIARNCKNRFPAFLVMGLTLMLVTQALINMMVAVGLFPVTGQPLPLISRGGTSTIINCIYIGMILSVCQYAKKNDEGDTSTDNALPAPKEG